MNLPSLNFNSYSQYYDLLYRDKDYEAEVAYIKRLLTYHNIPRGNLLEFGSGTGKHGCLLAADGYRVHGIERSAEMVANASVASGFTCEQGDIAHTVTDRPYEAILSLFHVICYQTSNHQLESVLNNAAAHLETGGVFIFDFWYSPAVYTQRPTVRVKRMTGKEIEITRIAEPVIYPNENRVDVKYTIYAKDLITNTINYFQEVHPMRHFSLPEIDVLARIHGFERVQTEEFLSGNPPSENTWSICVVLRKT